MVNIVTLSDKILINKSKNFLSEKIAEILFKNNFRINSRIVLSCNDDLKSLSFNSEEIYIILTQKIDICSENLSSVLNVPLQVDEYIKTEVNNYYKSINEPVDSYSIKTWQIPQGARAIINSGSNHHGYLIDKNEKLIFVLPICNDTYSMFENSIMPYLLEHKTQKFKSNSIRTFGLAENNIRSVLKDLINNKSKVSVNIFSNGLNNDIILKAKETNNNLDLITRDIYQKLDKFIYSVTDLNLTQTFEKLIYDKDIKFSIVEAISGGNLVSNFAKITRSQYIDRCYVIDNQQSLKQVFGLDDNTNDASEITYMIAERALATSKSDLIIVTNGIFDNNSNKSITYIAIGDKNKIDIYKNIFFGNEEEVINNITNSTLFYAVKKIKENDFVFYNK